MFLIHLKVLRAQPNYKISYAQPNYKSSCAHPYYKLIVYNRAINSMAKMEDTNSKKCQLFFFFIIFLQILYKNVG